MKEYPGVCVVPLIRKVVLFPYISQPCKSRRLARTKAMPQALLSGRHAQQTGASGPLSTAVKRGVSLYKVELEHMVSVCPAVSPEQTSPRGTHLSAVPWSTSLLRTAGHSPQWF